MFKRTYLITTIFIMASVTLPADYELGRNNDPRTVDDIKPFKLFLKKARWEILSTPGMRFMANLYFPESTIINLEVENAVAFTIDDGFCGIDNPSGDMTSEVLDLFDKYNAKATFFTTGSHCKHTKKEDILRLLDKGHEIANHGMYDTPYSDFTKEDFEKDFNQTDQILRQYTNDIPKWYRAPHASLSKTMQEVIDQKGYTHVVCDGFANDTSIPDPRWISNFILRKIKDGSIILIHMPERGIREWNLEAMELTLKGLKEKGYDIVTFSKLYELSK